MSHYRKSVQGATVWLSYFFFFLALFFSYPQGGRGVAYSVSTNEEEMKSLTSAPVDVEIALSEDGLDLFLAEDLLKIPRDDVVFFCGS